MQLSEGDTVAVEVEPTKDWPEPDIPEDFQTALAAAPDISELWMDITSMARWEWVRWIQGNEEPRDSEPARRGWNLETAIW